MWNSSPKTYDHTYNMITLTGPNNVVLVRSALKQGCGDPDVLQERLGISGNLTCDQYLIAFTQPNREQCYTMFHLLYDTSIITMYHDCVLIIRGDFWKWGVSWLGKKGYPTVYYRKPEIMSCPIIWWV